MKQKSIWLLIGILFGIAIGFWLGLVLAGVEVKRLYQSYERKQVAVKIQAESECEDRIYEVLHRLDLSGFGRWTTTDGEPVIEPISTKRRVN